MSPWAEKIVMTKGIVDGLKYRRVITWHLIPLLRAAQDNDETCSCIFKQDNAAAHTSQVAASLLFEHIVLGNS